jgi:hypothetical protein
MRVGSAINSTGVLDVCAGLPNHAMLCMGDNRFGQIGDGSNKFASTSQLVAGGTPFLPFELSSFFRVRSRRRFRGRRAMLGPQRSRPAR